MKRGRNSRLKFMQLFIAFAIAWLSLSSILNFHMSKIYGKNILTSIEFIKKDNKSSLKKDSSIILKLSLDTFIAVLNNDENSTKNTNYLIIQRIEKNNKIVHHYSDAISLRGPPQLFV